MKRFLLLLLISSINVYVFAQSVISTPFTNTNGQAGITFNVENTNATDGRVTDITSRHFNNSASVTVELWVKTSAISGVPGAISVANGWTMIASNTIPGSTTFSSFFPNLCYTVPAGQTYGFYVGTTGTIGYQTLTAGVQTFSGGGFNLITGTNIGYGGPKTGPTFTPRGFNGSITVTNSILLNDVGIADITSPGGCFGPNTPVTVKITNYGLNTQTSIPASARVTYPNLTSTTISGTYVGSIASCASAMYTFPTTVNTSPLGNYAVKSYTQLVGDLKLTNDTFNTSPVNNSLPYPYTENFNTGLQPAGYTGPNAMFYGLDPDWGEQHGTANSGGMFFNLYNGTPQPGYGNYFLVELPKMGALPPNAIFSFDYRLVDWNNYTNATGTPTSNTNGNDALNLQISTNCGLSWTTIKSINTGNHVVANTFKNITVDLSAYGGQVVKYRFEGIWGTGGVADYYVDIDNINIESKTINFSPTALLSPKPTGGCHLDSLKVVVFNKGGLAKDSVRLTVNVTGSIVANFTTLYTNSIPVGDSVIFNYGPLNLPGGGIINIKAYTSHPLDIIFTDDTLKVNGLVMRPLPVLTKLNDTVCITDSATIAVSGGVSYDWGMYGNTGTIKVYTLVSRFYQVTVTDGFGCVKSDSVSVGIRMNPIIKITTSDSFFCQNKSATLTGTGGVSYAWNNGQNTNPAIYTPLTSMIAKVIGTDMFGCKDSAAQQLTLFPVPIPVAFGDTICRGTYGTLSANGGLNYDWGSLGATKVVQANPTITTVYTVTVSDAIGCSASTTATIVVKDLPITVITNDSFCEGKSATLAALGGVTYNWGIQGTTSSIVVFPAKSTRYPVLVKGPNGCEKLDYAWAYLRNKPGILAFPDTVCQGKNAVISAGGGIAYNWGALGNTPTVMINNVMNSSSYPVTITDIHTCSNAGSVPVTVRNTPYITVENPTICVGASASVKANIYINGSTYNWGGSGSGQTITVNPTVTTEYKVTATDPFGCSVEGKSTVMVKAKPIVQINPSVIKSVCDDVRSINLEATPIGGMFYGTNVTFATFYPKVSQIGMFMVYYTYNESGNNGCSGTDSIEINVKSCKVTTAINNIEGVSQITTYPNPFNNQFNIEIVVKENTNIQLSLLELSGKIVEIKNPELYQGINNVRFETGSIAAGSYILKVSKGNESMSIPIVKQ